MLYIINRIENDNLIVNKTKLTRDFLIENSIDYARSDEYIILGRKVGLFYWNSCEKGADANYMAQPCYQSLYEYNGGQYIYFEDCTDLESSEYPLNRFSWQEDEDNLGIGELEKVPEKLRKIILEDIQQY